MESLNVISVIMRLILIGIIRFYLIINNQTFEFKIWKILYYRPFFFLHSKRWFMAQQSLAELEKTVPREKQQTRLSNQKKRLRNGKQLSTNNVIIIRWLTTFFCLACWYGVYKLINYVFLSYWIKASDKTFIFQTVPFQLFLLLLYVHMLYVFIS